MKLINNKKNSWAVLVPLFYVLIVLLLFVLLALGDYLGFDKTCGGGWMTLCYSKLDAFIFYAIRTLSFVWIISYMFTNSVVVSVCITLLFYFFVGKLVDIAIRNGDTYWEGETPKKKSKR